MGANQYHTASPSSAPASRPCCHLGSTTYCYNNANLTGSTVAKLSIVSLTTTRKKLFTHPVLHKHPQKRRFSITPVDFLPALIYCTGQAIIVSTALRFKRRRESESNTRLVGKSALVSVFSRHSLFRLVWVLWLASVVAGSLLPLNAKHLTRTIGPRHRIVHIVAFAGIALGLSSQRLLSPRTLLASASVVGLGALLELLQHYLYGNAYEWPDVRDDCLGVMVGMLLPLLRRAVAQQAQEQ